MNRDKLIAALREILIEEADGKFELSYGSQTELLDHDSNNVLDLEVIADRLIAKMSE